MTNKEIGLLLRTRREELKMTVNQVANCLGVSKSTVSRWETGNIEKVKRSHLFLLSQTLYLPIELLLGTGSPKIESAEIILARKQLENKINTIKDINKINYINKFVDTFILNEKE